MRKNLFLILALAFACFAPANAQWMKVLNAEDGLPGTMDASIGVEAVKTPLITPDAPVSGVRLTILQTRNMEKPDGYPTTSFSEIMFIDANGNTINYTPSTNAPQNESKGIAALNDGEYGSYMHTNWVAGNTPNDFHYIEFAFEAPVESFRLFWGNRKDKTTNAPTVAVLTEAGVRGVIADEDLPVVDLGSYELKGLLSPSQATSVDYVTLKTTNITAWKDDEAKNYGNYANWGPRFLQGPNSYSDPTAEASVKNAAKFIPAGDGTYLLYFCNAGGYLGVSKIDHTNSQAWLWLVTDVNKAAHLTLHDDGKGCIEMSFPTTLNDADETPVTGWVIADPRWWDAQNYALKVVTPAAKADIQSANPQYPEGSYKLPGSFGFQVYEADYSEPAYLGVTPLNVAIFDAILAEMRIGGRLDVEDVYETNYYETMKAGVATAEQMIATGCTKAEAEAHAEAMALNRVLYAYTSALAAIDEMVYLYDELADIQYDENWEPVYGWDDEGFPVHGPNSIFCTEANLVTGKYTRESWDAIVQAAVNNLSDVYVYKQENEGLTAEDYVPMLNDVAAVYSALEQFYAGKVELTVFPMVFNSADGLPGTQVSSRYTWQSPVLRPSFDAVEGFRVTFIKTFVEGSGDAVNKDKYPPVALGEMVVCDGAGNKLPITADMITINAQEHNEGPKSGLVDGTFDANGNITNYGDFYHSPWSSNYTWDPEGLIYFDVKLPEGVSAFSVKLAARNNFFYPLEVCISEYGVEYDPIASSPNPYNVAVGAQVTDPAQITDFGVYAIQGIIKTNPNPDAVPEPMQPNWYAGRTTYHTSILREGCAYFFIANGDGTFKILNLKESQFWGANGSLVSTSAEAGNFHFDLSENADFAGQNTFVIYSDIAEPEVLTASCEYVDEESGLEIIVDETEVTCAYEVLMDWGPGYGVHSRPCIDPQPGVKPEWYGEQADIVSEITPALEATASFGDYLHFNKTSGEGEWKIYKLSMNNPYYFWLTSLVDVVGALGLEPGENPGQLKDAGSFASDLAAAQSVISANNYSGAEAAAKKLAATVEGLVGGEVERNPIENKGTYMIEAAHKGFGRRYAMFVQVSEDGNIIKWGSKPASMDTDDAKRFVFEMKTPSNIEELVVDGLVSEAQKASVFTIMNVATGEYFAGVDLVEDIDQASAYLFGRGATDIYDIDDLAGEGHSELHCGGHGGGSGTGGNVVLWDGDPNDTSASAWRLIKVGNATSIDNLVVEGSEVESVKYYTVGGAQIAAPVKGINIISIRYTNGVEKTEKIVVE